MMRQQRDDAAAFPATRAAALERLHEFSGVVKRYAGARNFVAAGHDNVSRLSAAIRHRLLTEEEVVRFILDRHEFAAVEKFLQEVCWRTYWKGWLAQRPQVWEDAAVLATEPPCELALRVMDGRSGCEVMDDFTIELKQTGYLHNHARMWWAAFWVHHLRLPWALGADFFMRHLLDADAASNTLSWRWVAGLHTVGKTYLARPDNIARYHPHGRTGGLENLGNTTAYIPQNTADVTIHPLPHWPTEISSHAFANMPVCLLIHPEDLSVEWSCLRKYQPQVVVVLDFCEEEASGARQAWRRQALNDAAQRALDHYGVEVIRIAKVSELARWVAANADFSIVGMAPQVGSLADALTAEMADFTGALTWLQRPWDRAFFSAAKGSFFAFWKKISRAEIFLGRQGQMEFPL